MSHEPLDRPIRSRLVARANRPDLFEKFPRHQADLFAIDLEDRTPEAEKASAPKGSVEGYQHHLERAFADLHHNIFYSYRGPDLVDVDRDRQLENNLTKALINTLSLGGEVV